MDFKKSGNNGYRLLPTSRAMKLPLQAYARLERVHSREGKPKETKKLIHKFDVKTGGIKAVTQPLIKC